MGLSVGLHVLPTTIYMCFSIFLILGSDHHLGFDTCVYGFLQLHVFLLQKHPIRWRLKLRETLLHASILEMLKSLLTCPMTHLTGLSNHHTHCKHPASAIDHIYHCKHQTKMRIVALCIDERNIKLSTNKTLTALILLPFSVEQDCCRLTNTT